MIVFEKRGQPVPVQISASRRRPQEARETNVMNDVRAST